VAGHDVVHALEPGPGHPPVLIICSLRLVSSGLDGRLGIFRSLTPGQR
jgi:hypothetical protein